MEAELTDSRRKSVLVVEGERAFACDLQRALVKLGYEAGAIVDNGADALGHAASFNTSLVLLNIDIGGELDGIETACRMRDTHHIPVVFHSTDSNGANLSRAKVARPYGFLRSPFEDDELMTVIELALHNHAMERQLQVSEERLARVVETNTDATFLTDPEGRITLVNAAAEKIFGIPREELLRRTHDDLAWQLTTLDDEPFEANELPFNYVREHLKPLHDFECKASDAQGNRLVFSVNSSPLFDNHGHFAGVAAMMTDITERKSLEQRLYVQAFHDPLTGLPNRTLFMNRLTHSLARAGRGENDVAVVFIDLDNFKLVNDSLGHAIGDQLLKAVSDRLIKCLRAGDTAARFGGDEFVLLIDELANPEQALRVAERIQASLQEPLVLDTREIFATLTIGVAFSQFGKLQPDELLRNADAAMYEAKRKGRSRTEVFEDALSEAALHRLETENYLRRAVHRDELLLHYQPKIDLVSGAVYAVEALVRWHHPERGVIAPSEFINMAEETGLIVPIGQWVLREACKQAYIWQRLFERLGSPSAPLGINVNLSPRQLQHPGLVDDVARTLRESGLGPSSLILELSEDAAMAGGANTLATLKELKEIGVRLAIDDFGSGYSSLTYLRSFPFDFVKIDRKFITGMDPAQSDAVIVSSMIDLAHSLKLTVVAEGTESNEEADQLRRMGCDLAQGYFFAHPMSSEEMESFLSDAVN